MGDLDRTIADAQSFIDSMKEFHHEHERRIDSDGSNPSSSSDYSLQGDLKEPIESERLGSGIVFGSIPDRPVNSNSTRSLASIGPVGNFETGHSKNGFGFPTHKFSPELPFRAEVITFIEVYYYENKKLPEVHVLHEHFSDHNERPNFLKGWKTVLDEVSDSLSNRGIKPYNTVENYIDPKFAWATSLIVNHLDKRTIPAKLKEAGLSTKEWQAFLRRKRHYDYFQARLDEVFDKDVKNDAKIALSRSIQNGDLQAIKYYNELQNIYRPETQNALQMVSIVLTAVMEILAVHVRPEVLNTVAAEIRTSPTVRKIIESKAS